MDNAKALTYEEAKELCRNAFVSGTLYGTESIRYGTDAIAYNWDHWLREHEDRFKPPDTWESIIYDAMQAGRTEETIDVTPLINRCKALVDIKIKALEDKISELTFHEDMER